ncbi:hypothetical protein [Halorussus caseinilyticus]|uniref:Uncharacterized protein n=1 Tax=Halorussus caseinilyticus TaxID=3034025 RepID=A0ABD5WIZ5_9EURY
MSVIGRIVGRTPEKGLPTGQRRAKKPTRETPRRRDAGLQRTTEPRTATDHETPLGHIDHGTCPTPPTTGNAPGDTDHGMRRVCARARGPPRAQTHAGRNGGAVAVGLRSAVAVGGAVQF